MGTRVYVVEAAGRERSHPLGEPEGRAVCVLRLFWSCRAFRTIKEDGGRGEIRGEVQGVTLFFQ